VLHHGPDPRRAFAQVAARVKPGGRLAVWLYRKNTPPQEWLNTGLRILTTRLPARVLEPLCAGLGLLGGVPVVNRTLNKLANFSNHPDWTLRVCDNFDWYAPRYQSHHTIEELRSWFTEEGFEELSVLSPARGGRLYDWARKRRQRRRDAPGRALRPPVVTWAARGGRRDSTAAPVHPNRGRSYPVGP
jgi:SAM-dependent methyltransferase